MTTKFFDSLVMLRFGKKKVAKKEFCGANKNSKMQDVDDVDNVIISKLIETKNNSRCLIGQLDESRLLVLTFSKMSGYV